MNDEYALKLLSKDELIEAILSVNDTRLMRRINQKCVDIYMKKMDDNLDKSRRINPLSKEWERLDKEYEKLQKIFDKLCGV